MPNAAIKGLGRIGRAALKILLDTDGLDLVAVNDIADVDNLAYLLRYDTVYGRYHRTVNAVGRCAADRRYADRGVRRTGPGEPTVGRPRGRPGAGMHRRLQRRAGLTKHLQAGARYVILSAPTSAQTVPTVVHGVNRPDGQPRIVSCASCTTNCITPVIEVVHRRIGVQRAVMTTVHAYTAGQQLVDGPSKNFRRGRAGAANLVPTSTGAARATTRPYPSSPAGSTASRSARPSRWDPSPTSSSSPAGRPPPSRSTTRSGGRPRPNATTASSASPRIRWCPPTSSATHGLRSSTSI